MSAWTEDKLVMAKLRKRMTGESCRTWPLHEQIIDVIHKAAYAFATGYVVDRWLH